MNKLLFFLNVVIISVIITVVVVYAWNSPTASPSNPAGQAMFISSTGNVGIGTTAPSQKLHVIGQSIKFDGVASTNLELILNRSKDWRIVSRNDNKFMIYDYTDDSSTNNAFTIDITGNVGIGTTAPSEKLEVNGNIKMGWEIPSAGGFGSANAVCSSGNKVIGGGCSSSFGQAIVGSQPYSDNQWACTVASGWVDAYAICARIK